MNGSGAAIPVVITRFIMASDPVTRDVEKSPLLGRAGFLHGFTTRDATLADLGLEAADVYTVTQVHGSVVVPASGAPDAMRAEKADAMVLRGRTCGAVRVADCVPVLVADPETGRAAAIHAGWRGVASGVVPAALAALGARPAGLIAAIGPCIEPCCFEVGEEVADAIELAVPAPGVVARRVGAKAFVDLVTAIRAQLAACGVGSANVDRVGGCTKCGVGRYHSFRRDGAASGRMMGVIAAREGTR
jgi:YfiH family protein